METIYDALTVSNTFYLVDLLQNYIETLSYKKR